MLKKNNRRLPVAAIGALAVAILTSPMLAHADDHDHDHDHDHGNGNGLLRMNICHYNVEGVYELKSLPVKAALKHIANHELDKEPHLGDDGVETCILVEEPPEQPACNVTFDDGSETTITEYVRDSGVELTRYNVSTGSNACRLFYQDGDDEIAIVQLFNLSAGSDVFFDTTRVILDSEEQYDACASELFQVAQAAELEGLEPCLPYMVE